MQRRSQKDKQLEKELAEAEARREAYRLAAKDRLLDRENEADQEYTADLHSAEDDYKEAVRLAQARAVCRQRGHRARKQTYESKRLAQSWTWRQCTRCSFITEGQSPGVSVMLDDAMANAYSKEFTKAMSKMTAPLVRKVNDARA